jgi:hypothetical protein
MAVYAVWIPHSTCFTMIKRCIERVHMAYCKKNNRYVSEILRQRRQKQQLWREERLIYMNNIIFQGLRSFFRCHSSSSMPKSNTRDHNYICWQEATHTGGCPLACLMHKYEDYHVTACPGLWCAVIYCYRWWIGLYTFICGSSLATWMVQVI